MGKTLYLWDLADTLIIEIWDRASGYLNYEDYLVRSGGYDMEKITDREYEEGYENPMKEGLLKLDIADGYKEVLEKTKNNETFTTGVPEQMLKWRPFQLNPKVGFDVTQVFNKVNSTFDFGETNKKTPELEVKLLKQKIKEGYDTIIYTDNDLEKCEQYRKAGEKVKQEFSNFDYRIYRLMHDLSGIKDKDWYYEVGTLYDLWENEREKIN